MPTYYEGQNTSAILCSHGFTPWLLFFGPLHSPPRLSGQNNEQRGEIMSQIETTELSLNDVSPIAEPKSARRKDRVSEIERLTEEKQRNEAKARRLENEVKALTAEAKGLRRKERNHRIFTRGGMLEAFLQEPLLLTNDQVYTLLKIVFHKPEIDRMRRQMIEESKRKIAEDETR